MSSKDDKSRAQVASSAKTPQKPGKAAQKGRGRGEKVPAGPRGKDRIVVTDSALAKIVGLSAHEVPGVVGMAPTTFTEGIRRILGTRQVDEGVVIARGEKEDVADVDIYVVVAYGVNIPVVADSVRERVRYAAMTYAGASLAKVRVHVAGVSRA